MLTQGKDAGAWRAQWSNMGWDRNRTDRLWREVGPLSGLGCDLGIHSVSPKAMGPLPTIRRVGISEWG